LADENEQRNAVIAAAHAWIGTPFHDGACTKGIGVDCAQLVRIVAIEAGIADVAPTGPYGAQWMLHRDDERLIDFVRRYAREIEASMAKPGDVIAYRIARAYAHLAILVAPDRIIHAHKHMGFVIESAIDGLDLSGRERRYFSPWR